MELLENIDIINHIIKLVKSRKLPYRPIYSFSLIELEVLKTYIKTYLKICII